MYKMFRALALAGALATCAVAQNAALMPVPKMQFLDANGMPLAGGMLYACSAGASCAPSFAGDPPLTPLATYTDSTASTPNANPIVLDSAGRASVWLGAGSYKLVLQDATGAAVWTQDNVTSLQALKANGVNFLSYTASLTGAVTRTVAAKLGDTINARDFGAVCDGSTDDTAHLQAAVNALTTGQTLIIPASSSGCLVSSPGLTVNNLNNVTIAGSGLGAKLLSTAVTPAWSFINVSGANSYFTIQGLTFAGSSTTSQAVYANMACAVKIPASATGGHFKFLNNVVTGTESGVCNSSDVYSGEVAGSTFYNLVDPSFSGGRGGVFSVGAGWMVHHNVFSGNPFQDVYLSGDAAPGGSMNSSATDNYSYGCGTLGHVSACFTSGAYLSSVTSIGLIFSGNHIVNPHAMAISFDGHMQGVIVDGNEVTGADGALLTGGEGLISATGAVTIGGGSTASIIANNTIKNSTGTLPGISITDGNANQVVHNTLQNNPSQSPGILVATIEGGTITSNNIVEGNIVSGGGAVSIQSAGTGAVTNSSFLNNVIDGTIFNVDLALSAGNIVAGNNSPTARYWTAQSQLGLAKLSIGSYAGVTAAPSNGLIVSGSSGFGDPAPTYPISVGAPSGAAVINVGISTTNEADLILRAAPANYAWLFGVNHNLNNTIEITPSTATGGSTFSTPVFSISQPGAVTIPNIKATSGTPYVCVNTAGTLVKSAAACSGT